MGGSLISEPAYDTVVYWGADYANTDSDAFGLDAGFVTALNGNIAASGWIMSGSIGYGNTDAPLSETDSVYGTLLLGYQWVMPDFYVSLAGGAHVVNNDENPPGGITDGSEFGAIAQYGFETTRTNSLYFQSYGSFSTAYDQVYLHAKAGYKLPTLRFGGEFTVFDEVASSSTLRYGAFVGDIPLTDRLSMVVSAGYQDEQGSSDDGFYATIGFAVPFSLR
ncbi:cellulose biosynthesis protein BcsS [Pseudohoeflea coraliihabitans]|uniref:Cellulose biosynthesis protein BcsS n=1 Tax=Pseudohoeflea coraliihabitans TaxID=2860393 RepID=A0ABS6WJA1_9HYPH|nr:cellulose biosynthesis protein BcsS [Pseudohoeflea sp. DP4N28-3]MBW3096024.1 cellulose biosynthesis protein BcsS [Pseudohoeflea sp. DP4N28-3]